MRFSTRLLRKGALIDETRMVLRHWNPQISVRENVHVALENNPIGAKSAGWLSEIFKTLSSRLSEIKIFELAGLQALATSAASDEVWRASFHWHCARTDQMYYAFATGWLFNTYRQGVYRIRTQDLVPLVSDLTTQAKGKGASFSDYGVTRAARDLLLTATDFGLLKGKAVREFVSFHLPEESFLYLLHARGLLGAITSRTGFFLSSFQEWREEILLKEAIPIVFADFGNGVMDSAMVEAAAYCLEKGNEGDIKIAFLRILEEQDKAKSLFEALHDPLLHGQKRFDVNKASFLVLPQATFAYWISPQIRSLFENARTLSDIAETRRGMATLDDFRFIRCRWEIKPNSVDWMNYSKGDTYRPFFESFSCLVNWKDSGREVKSYVESKVGSASRTIQAEDYYFKPGITWVRRTHHLCMRVLPRNVIFSGGAQAAFSHKQDPETLLWLLSLTSSAPFDALTKVGVGRTGDAVQFEPGMISRVPLPRSDGDTNRLASLAQTAWSINWRLDTVREESHAFILPAVLQATGSEFDACRVEWARNRRANDVELAAIQAEIDNRCYELYGIDENDRGSIIKEDVLASNATAELDDDELESDDDTASNADISGIATELMSWAVGVAFGRFDVRLATGERELIAEPGPFDPLPVCSPGMLTGDDGLPLLQPPSGYPLTFPEAGILVDDPGHGHDLTASVRLVFNIVFGNKSDQWWNDISVILDSANHNLRSWLMTACFDRHIKRYSKSRRRAPIFWQLGIESHRYSVWVYAHRLTHDSFFRILEIVGQKLFHEEKQLGGLIQAGGESATSAQRKEIAEQESFVEELRAFRDEITRIAPLWNPDLNDGVIINFAPLWRLVPQHKAWQKECKECWERLVDAEYDWAHVAMHLWPERVVPKCADDRSLAIAHGLEDVFWSSEFGVRSSELKNSKLRTPNSELSNSNSHTIGKWVKQKVDKDAIDKIIAERTSPAVKAALKSLLVAPTPGTSKSRRNSKPRTSKLQTLREK